ncbi:hypothetical protein [Undibacterium sp. TS12]|uniref:hypothetical protein n=1 Tax=Undibacterium sp. TS12 TaxID=2908202 RepID=UPI001F4CF984|nr:hypothetical protein [Undibacterium sp. TS12]MCH8622828.1 hypothetical protein [Undibacterium sp. TS12]
MSGPDNKPVTTPIPTPVPTPAQPTAEQKLDKIIKDFGDANKTATNNPGDDLAKVLDASPDLKKRILDSVDQGYLTRFQALPANSGTGGSYDPTAKAINVPMDVLKQADKSTYDKGELIFVMGHEIQHSFNAAATSKTTQDFLDGAGNLAQSKASPHDYTKLTGDFIDASRKDEASAHIGGFNAIASQARKNNPQATLEDIFDTAPGRMRDFITVGGTPPNNTYTMKPGLTLNADMSMPYSPDNIASMGKYYFDKPASESQLGSRGNLDYTNFYGSWAVGVVGNNEKVYQDFYQKNDNKYVVPEVQFDMKKLGLQQDLVTQNVKFSDNKAFSYVDISDGKKQASTFDPNAPPAPKPPANPVTSLAQAKEARPELPEGTAAKADAKTESPLSSVSRISLLTGDNTPSSRLLASLPETPRAEQAKPR